MIFRENPLLADDSHEKSCLISLENSERCQNLSSAAVMIDALRVKVHAIHAWCFFVCLVCGLTSQSTAMVMSGWSFNLTTLYLDKLA